MSIMRWFKLSDARELYEIVMREEPYDKGFTLEHFKMVIAERDAWTVEANGRIIGCVSLSDYRPRLNIVLHAFVDNAFRGLWISRGMLSMLFKYCFSTLELPRVSGFCIIGVNDRAGQALLRIGFKSEGTSRHAALINGNYHDVAQFGMLREECRWLR